MRATFKVDGTNDHVIGDSDCNEGWCGDSFPKPCECGGLIHAEFGDENYDMDYWLWLACDVCGSEYREKES